MKVVLVLACVLSAGLAVPLNDPVISKWDPEGLRYSYMEDDQGKAHLVDHWLKLSDLDRMARYNPDQSNVYHLFTRQNPTTSQPMVLNDADRVFNSNFNRGRRTVMIMHGFIGSATSEVNRVLVPAFLEAADVNVIVLDWSAGSYWGPRAIEAGQAAGRFINWLNGLTGYTANLYHIVGFSVGGHGAGIIARNVNGNVAYVTGLDPAERWDSAYLFSPSDGLYTEVIHTSTMAEVQPLADADFYPNGGLSQPGCITSICEHDRSFHYLAESLRSGGFTARRCNYLDQALQGRCDAGGTLRFGGIEPKTGNYGIFHFTTNSRPPFSQG